MCVKHVHWPVGKRSKTRQGNSDDSPRRQQMCACLLCFLFLTAHTAPHNGRYEGEWRHGHRHGQGTYEYANGDRYVGQWERGQQHGKGTLFGHDASKRDSSYAPKKIVASIAYLALYSWRNGVQHGQGLYIDADGKVFKATWENGKGYLDAPLIDNSAMPEPKKSTAPASGAAKKPLTFADISAGLKPKSNAEIKQMQDNKEDDANEDDKQIKETPMGVEVPEDGTAKSISVVLKNGIDGISLLGSRDHQRAQQRYTVFVFPLCI